MDYWGSYEIDTATNALRLTVESGNIPTPRDFDGEGTFEIREDGSLVLRDMWLGSPPNSEQQATACGHVFSPM